MVVGDRLILWECGVNVALREYFKFLKLIPTSNTIISTTQKLC